VPEQYRLCEVAFDLVSRSLGVARVIARPFVGREGAFTRTANRHDFALPPTSRTLLDELTERAITVTSIGKVNDLFAGRGIGSSFPTPSDDTGMDRVLEAIRDDSGGLVFSNLVDFDMLYGHRRDTEGYAKALEHFDTRLPEIESAMRDDDVMMITADHGNDPTFRGSDHTREYAPLLVYGKSARPGVDLGTRSSLADIGQTIAENFGLNLTAGTSFLSELTKQ